MVRTSLRRSLVAAAALTVTASIALTGCGSSSDTAGAASSASGSKAPMWSELPADVQKAGKVTVASGVGYAPFETFDTDGKTVVGIDPDIAKGLSERLGVTLTFQNVSFDGIIPGLTAGRYDMAMSGMSDTAERQKQVSFVDYFAAGPGILTTKADSAKYTSLDTLCGVKVAVSKGTLNEQDASTQSTKCTSEGKPAVETTVYSADTEAIQALKAGRADVFLVDSSSGATVAAQSNGAFVMGPRYTDIPFGIVFPKDSTQLMTAVQKALQDMVTDGDYAKVLAKYDQSQGAITDVVINGSKA